MKMNKNEQIVLQACIDNQNENGGDFGFGNEVAPMVESLSVNQVAGYLSALQSKSYIYVDGVVVEGKLCGQFVVMRAAVDALAFASA
jgi:hypothetical protein|tara:strand:+ start:7132 stop:7392 length:261 start_codon:yes stop_codon:yes gene_type:complete